MYIKTDGIVLREVAYQDSDKLLTVLTREYGKLTVRARGVRSSRSRSKAACQLLAYSEFTLLERGGRYVVTEATAKEMFPELRNDLELLSLASYFAQAADVLSPEVFRKHSLNHFRIAFCLNTPRMTVVNGLSVDIKPFSDLIEHLHLFLTNAAICLWSDI